MALPLLQRLCLVVLQYLHQQLLTQPYMPDPQLRHPMVGPIHLVGMGLQRTALPFCLALALVLALTMDWQQQVNSSVPCLLPLCCTATQSYA